MPESWILNASPIIVLAKVDRTDLISGLADEALVPMGVAEEVLAAPPDDPARKLMEGGWGVRIREGSIPAPVLEWGLGKGESAVLAVACERPGAVAILDDAEGRSCARAMGVPVLGTLGIILRARKRRLIRSAADLIRSLRSAGLHLDDALIREALRRSVGEDWVP